MKAPSSPSAADTRDGIAYAELLKIAHEEGLRSIATELLREPSAENGQRCIVKAIVEVERGRFEGLGDADPGNVEPDFAPHLIRVAETRAKARALRDACNVGVVSLEELDGRQSAASVQSPGSGAPASPRPVHSGARTSAPAPPTTTTPAAQNGAPEPMTENQRRFLFRLLATQGLTRQAAHEHLLGHFQVFSLAEITKAQASAFIDELQSRPRGNGHDAPGRPALQR